MKFSTSGKPCFQICWLPKRRQAINQEEKREWIGMKGRGNGDIRGNGQRRWVDSSTEWLNQYPVSGLLILCNVMYFSWSKPKLDFKFPTCGTKVKSLCPFTLKPCVFPFANKHDRSDISFDKSYSLPLQEGIQRHLSLVSLPGVNDLSILVLCAFVLLCYMEIYDTSSLAFDNIYYHLTW